MSIQEIWKIKESLSEKFWGKSADDINNMIKPDVDDMKRRIDELRRKNAEKQRLIKNA
ncbi:MAG: hypothetical protein FWF92_02760 [Oscillospiraceae bacterium]|nr:hypothetical protein [Oscillospiraceae bacterium]